MEFPVATFFCKQLTVAARLDDSSMLHHYDAIRMLDGREPVGDDQSGAPAAQPLDRFLNMTFGMAIERGGRLIQKQYGRIFEDGAGDRQPLALPSR